MCIVCEVLNVLRRRATHGYRFFFGSPGAIQCVRKLIKFREAVMSYTDRMTPKLRAVRARLPQVITDLNHGNARAILEVSEPLVPVDTGALKRSGRVVPAKKNAAVLVYGGGPINYAGVVHYRLGVNHPVGQAQYVGQPLRTERRKRLVATARAFRKWLKGI